MQSCIVISRSQIIASGLLNSQARWVESSGDRGLKFVKTSIARLLYDSELEGWLFKATGFNREERAAIFGFGNEDIDLEFARIKREFVCLARTGRCSQSVIAGAEAVLESLVRGMQQEEWDAKLGVNPREAEANAKIYRLLAEDSPSNGSGSVTPNDIDHWQGESLLSYQSCKAAKNVLIEMLDAVRRIDRAMETDGPPRTR